MSVVLAAGAAFAVATAGSWALVRWHDRIPIVDVPNARSSHDRPKPRSGGLAIFLGLMIGCALASYGGGIDPLLYHGRAAIFGGAAGFFLVGLADDIFGLPEWTRLLVQAGLAAAVASWGPRLGSWDIPGMGPLRISPALSSVLVGFWYVGFVNAFNFMDGTDGLAAGEAVLAGAAMWLLGAGPLPLLAAAAAAGFLTMNYQPARIFMGDGGSYLLGYLLAISAVVGGGVRPFGAFVLVLGTFLVDPAATLLRRMARGERWYKAHRSHYYQKLTNLGWTHAQVFWANVVLTCVLVFSAFLYAGLDARGRLAAAAVWSLAFGGIIAWIRAEEKRTA